VSGKDEDSGSPVIWAIFAIVWGFGSFWRYKRFSGAYQHKPSDSRLMEVDRMLSEIWKLNLKRSENAVHFFTNLYLHRQTWKGQLDEEAAILVMTRGQDVAIASKGEVMLERKGRAGLTRSLRVKLTVGTRVLNCVMSAESANRFEKWKTGTIVPSLVS